MMSAGGISTKVVKALPKTELHLHLEGSFSDLAQLELIRRRTGSYSNYSVGDLQGNYKYSGFQDFIRVWRWKNSFLREYDDFQYVSKDLVYQLAAVGVVYAEVHFSPGRFISSDKKLELAGIAEAIRSGFDAATECDVEVKLIVDVVRNNGPTIAQQILEELTCVISCAGIVAVGLGGNELAYPAEAFRPVFSEAERLGLGRVVHVGEVTGPESILNVVNHLSPDRIGHATSAGQSISAMEQLRGVPIEVCLSSNVATKTIDRIEDHPLRQFIDEGLTVTLSSDDPPMFQTNLVNEYMLAHNVLGLSLKELFDVAKEGFLVSFASDTMKKTYSRQLEQMCWSELVFG